MLRHPKPTTGFVLQSTEDELLLTEGEHWDEDLWIAQVFDEREDAEFEASFWEDVEVLSVESVIEGRATDGSP